MPKKKNLSRFLNFLLAFCMVVSMLPAQALAASSTDNPATWPAPDSKYTAPGGNPVYVWVDFSTDDGTHITSSHNCTQGGSTVREIVKTTETEIGYVKYTCNACGSWAQIDIPRPTADWFGVLPEYQDLVTNGTEYSGQSYTAGMCQVLPQYMRFGGTQFTHDDDVTVSDAGTYWLSVTYGGSTGEHSLYDNVTVKTNVSFTIRPKAVPWTTTFTNKTYDGTSAITGKKADYTDINGQTVNVPLQTFLTTMEDGVMVADTDAPITAPVAAGYYVVRAEIPDKNYAWTRTPNNVSIMDTRLRVYPKTNSIYVGSPASGVTYTTGSASTASDYNWSIDTSYTGFDSSKPGTTNVRFNVTRKDGTAMEQMVVPVTVIANTVASVENVSVTNVMGTAFNQLGLPTTVSVTTGGGTTVSVPVTWSSAGYNPYAASQTISGTLNASGITELTGANLPAVTAAVTLTEQSVAAPSISNYTKTYDGKATALPLPSMPTGIQSATVTYSSGGSTAPVNAGTYTATVSFTMANGYTQLPSVTVSYTINKAAQTCPKPTLASKTTSSLTLNTVQNAEYSMDGTTWQDSPTFSGLSAGTEYTLYQRLKATSDGNYEVSPAVSDKFTTEYNTVTAPTINDYTKTYDGKSTALPLPAVTAGIQSMNVTYHGTTSSGNPYSSPKAPTNAGTYTATISYVMENGYAQLPSTTVKYIINKASQNFPDPVLASATTTTLTLVAVDGAEYSKDGNVWQDSPVFKNLDPGTTYTLYQRLKETGGGNYETTPTTSGQFSTQYNTVNPGDLDKVIQPQSYPYTGSPIAYQVPNISYVTKTTVTYTVDGKTTTAAPTNAGTYPVSVSFTMQAGAAQIDPKTTTLTITKIEQNAPAAPRASSTGTNGITITAIPGAEFSIDGGETWQTSTLFDGLTPDTAYTIQAKYPGDQNHYESPISSSVIRTTRQNATSATVQSAVYTYDGTPKSLVADVPTGCTEAVQTFTGTNGTAYGPTTEPPVNPGVYNVKVSYTMRPGYETLQPQYATLTINKATPARPLAPVVTGVTDSSITIKVEDGMAYSIDGGTTWQTTDTFTGLNRDTTYEIKVKAVETPCYKELEGPSTMQATEKTLVTFEKFADQTVEYNGHAQTYTLPKSVPGISSMTITGYDGIATPPVTVGDYEVNIDFVAADGYKLPDTLPTPVLHITRASGEAGTIRPVLRDETVTYTGAPRRYHGADGIEGIASVALTYTNADGVESTTAPTNAGVYTVTAIFSPDANHTLAAGNYTAILTIRKAGQDTPMASLENSSSHSLTVSAIPGAEYSIDGGSTWQTSNTFTGLDADKDYTILVRMAEDENHTASGTRPVSGRTTDTPVDILDGNMPAYHTIYNGNRQPYPYTSLLTDMEGIKSVSVMYVGTLASGKPYETSEAPVNAGTYKVRFYLIAEDTYDLSADQVYADMTISKAPQTMPAAPTIARRTTTTIALNPVPGAEYSIDGGETWQDSPKFTGLTPDTEYTFTQRMKETDNLTASDSQSVEGRTVADTGLKYEINFREEIITFDPDVVEAGEDYTLTDDLPNGGTIIPGTTIYVRLVDDGTGEPGPVVMDVLPERPAAPDVKVNPFDFTMNTTEDMEYSDDGGETWKPCKDNMNVEDRQGETLLVRIAATDNSFKSLPTTVTVPVRGEAPALTIDNATERMDTTAAMEYSKDNGASWITCLDNMDLSDLTNATLLVRYACDGENPASNNAVMIVPSRNAAPETSIGMETELLTTVGTVPEYRTENGWTAIPADGLDLSAFYGVELAVREKYDAEHFASLPVLVKVPEKGKKPDLTIDRDKQTVDTTADMEYSKDGGKTWTKCDPDMDVSDLTGQAILVREAPTDDKFASEPTELRIPNKTENPSVTLDTKTETIDTTEDMDYSTDGGKTWNPCTKPLDVSGLTGQTIIIRNHGDSDSFPSSGVPIQVPERRDAPKVKVDSKAQTVGSDKGVEFSTDGGNTWNKLDKALDTADYRGETILFRYPATKDDFASRTVTVLISNNPGTPVLVFDPNNETLNTTPDMEYSTDGGKTWKPCPSPMDVSDLDGKEILVRYPGGEPITVKIPARRMAPAVDHTDETQQGRNDGTLFKTDKTMEYRLLPDGKWTAIAGNTVKGLAPGTYEVRYMATAAEMASKVQTVVIAKGTASNNSGNNSNNGNNNNGDLNMSGSKLSLLNRKDHIAYITGRTSTQAAPNADITRAEVAAILYRLLTSEAKASYETSVSRFKDVSANDWYGTAVSTLTNLGVIAGYQDGSFGPQRNITRAELATILARFCGTVKDSAKDRFSDISGSWARKYINLAAEAGLVYGYTDGTFRPDQNITRAETIVMVNRILGRSVSGSTVLNGYKTFSDVTPDTWYYWDIVEASNLHTFRMDGSAEKWTALG